MRGSLTRAKVNEEEDEEERERRRRKRKMDSKGNEIGRAHV